MPKPEIDPSLTWDEVLQTAVDDTTVETLFQDEKTEPSTVHASHTPGHYTGYWGNYVDAAVEALWIRPYHVQRSSVPQLQALTSSSGLNVGDLGRVATGSLWRCTSIGLSGSSWVPVSGRWSPIDYGAAGDGVTDDRAVMQTMLNDAYAYSLATGTVARIQWPTGYTFACASVLWLRSFSYHELDSTLLFTGGNNIGGFILILNEQYISVVGQGVIDANMQANDNPLAIGGNYESDDLAMHPPVLATRPTDTPVQPAANIFVQGITIRNARHLGGIEDIGVGGGKGITVQFGNQNIVIESVTIEDCDIGLSQEGDEQAPDSGNDHTSYGIIWSNVRVVRARYMGAYLATSAPEVEHIMGCRFSNVQFFDCASGLDDDENPICESFGIITLNGAAHVDGTAVVWNSSGRVTVVRGGGRKNNLKVVANVDQLRDAIDMNPHGGHSPFGSPTRRSRYEIELYVHDGTGIGYGVRGNAAQLAQGNAFDLTWCILVGSSFQTTWPGSAEFDTANLGTGNLLRGTRIGNTTLERWVGTTIVGDGVTSPAQFLHLRAPASATTEVVRYLSRGNTTHWREQMTAAGSYQLVMHASGVVPLSISAANGAIALGVNAQTVTVNSGARFSLPVVTDASRGTPTGAPAFIVFNSDDNGAVNIWNGSGWIDALGNPT